MESNNKKMLKNKDNTSKISIEKEISKNSIESNFDIDLLESTEAYYSERYGWTLRKQIKT